MFGLALLGYVAARLGWFSDEAAGGLARFVFDFAVPLMLVRVFTHARLPDTLPWPFLASFYGPAAALYGLGVLVSGRVFGRNLMERTMGGFSRSFGNSVLLGLPLALLTLGEDAMIPYFILLSVHGFTLPGPVDRTLEYIQLAVTPCALFSLGASLTQCRIAGRLPEPVFLATVKCALMPALVWLTAVPLLGLPAPWSQAAILLAAQPTGVNVYLLAARYAAARDLATTTVFLSTTFSLVSVAAVLYLLPTIG